jgi:radical SAM superfamily enzyme YgiQ (UPF0313 family)
LNDLDAPTMSALKASGLSAVGVSVESANQESLNLLRKGLRAAAIYPALRMLEELGIRCEVNMIFFDPWLTIEGVRKNLELLDYLTARSAIYDQDSSAPVPACTVRLPWSSAQRDAGSSASP